MKKKVLLWFFVYSFLIINITYATNYLLWYSAVDAWEIRWGWSTTYSTQLNSAIATWNNYWVIDILPDNALTYEDLRISDINDINEAWYWVYLVSSWTDNLKLNKAYMSGLTTTQRQNVITHELGHSLWLAHSIPNNIMIAVWELNRIVLWTQDKADYDYLW